MYAIFLMFSLLYYLFSLVKRGRSFSVAVAKDRLKKLSASEAETESSHVLPGHLPLTFVPDFIICQIFKDDAFSKVPYAVTSDVVLLVADVSGKTFT